MKKFKIAIIAIILVIIVLGIGIWFYIKSFEEDRELTKLKVKEINEAYPKFDQAINEFSKLRSDLYDNDEDLYYESLSFNANDWNSFITKYEDSIKNFESASTVLKKDCTVEYGDISARTKCNNFKANYEAANNYFITDIKMYNEMVDNYNKWNKEQGGKHPSIKKGELTVYDKYIDFDGDGEYFGKEEGKK